MDQFTIEPIASFTASLTEIEKEYPLVADAIQYAQTLIQAKPFESGFVIGKDGWRYFTTESVPRFIVYFYVDEAKKAIWLMKLHRLEGAE
jgi:hypothetical protein